MASLGGVLHAEEPKELQADRLQFKQAGVHPDEAARANYVTTLVRLRERFVRSGTGGWQSVDAEIRHHPAPKNADSKTLSRTLVGAWTSPRHDYLNRKDGTWVMLPNEAGTAHGTWRIEGNQFYSVDLTDQNKSRHPYTIVLLTGRDFVFTDGETVFYETRKRWF